MIVNVIDHGLDIDDAVSLPRFHHQWQPDVIRFDKFALNPDTREKLRRMGHQELVESNYGRGIGDANSILYKGGLITVDESRKLCLISLLSMSFTGCVTRYSRPRDERKERRQ